jgi:site-specific recombinase XerD
LALPLTAPTVRILRRYLKFGRPRTSLPEVFLGVLPPPRPMTRTAVAEVFRRRVKDAGLPMTEYSPYGLRHGFAMRLLERGVGIKAIGDLLGHRDLTSTSTYLRLDTEALREVALAVPKTSAPLAAAGAL